MTSSVTTTTNPLATTLYNGASTKEAQASKQAEESSTPATITKSKVAASDSVNFSNRALKIQSIASEFFSGDGLSMADIPSYVQRLQNDGFLTEQQAEKLGASNTESTETVSEASTKVISFLDDFKSTVSATEGNDSLIDLLSKVKSAVESLGSMSSKTTASNLKMIDIELKEYLKSDQAKQWSEEDLDSLKQVSSLLSIANELNYSPSNSKATNRYLQFSGR